MKIGSWILNMGMVNVGLIPLDFDFCEGRKGGGGDLREYPYIPVLGWVFKLVNYIQPKLVQNWLKNQCFKKG